MDNTRLCSIDWEPDWTCGADTNLQHNLLALSNQHGQITEQVVPGTARGPPEEYLLYVHLSAW
jgi:hypothetical protein